MSTLFAPIADPETINTPWAPQEIAWFQEEHDKYIENMRNQAASGLTHIVREVLAYFPKEPLPATIDNPGLPLPTTIDEMDDILSRASYEFQLMRFARIRVPDVQWHSFRDCEGRIRALARVGVVDGILLKEMRNEPDREVDGITYRQARMQIHAYQNSTFPGLRLCDSGGVDQYTVGKLRPDPKSVGLHYHDIELMF